MSGISRIKSALNGLLGLDEWGQRVIIPGTMDDEIVETNQQLPAGSIDMDKIKNLVVDTITISPTGYVKSGKTSFVDVTNAGWFLGPDGLVFGPVNGPANFSVDNEGNVIVKSLSRDDFHWFTLFESLDGFGITGATISANYVSVATTASTNNVAFLQKFLGIDYTWSQERKIKFGIDFTQVDSNTIFLGGMGGSAMTLTERRVGFYYDGSEFYGITADGTNYSTVVLGAFGSTLEIKFFPGNRAEFYIDNVYIDQLTTTLPTGTTRSERICYFYLKTLNDVSKEVRFYYYDFWQANK